MPFAIEVQDFAKSFKRNLLSKPVAAASAIHLSVEVGEVFGFLGPNGAGKTTTIKALLGLIRPDAGVLKLLGHPPQDFAWRKKVGYAAEHPVFPTYLSGLEMVSWFAQLSGMNAHDANRAADEALALVGLAGATKRRLKTYSKGMLQRAALAQAIVAKPELLILDEPMTGLDPIGRRDVRELILEMNHRGATVFYSTHILPDIEATCDRVAIIDKGRTYSIDSLANLLDQAAGPTHMVLDEAWSNKTDDHQPTPLRTGGVAYQFDTREEATAFSQEALQAGRKLIRFAPDHRDLESIFLTKLNKGRK